MCLLPKKSNLTDLGNWRPISLINTDVKVYARLINNRLMSYFQNLISDNKLGFMSGRFIGEHGQLLQNTKIIAYHNIASTSIALLLDQKKSYDRIHPDYLEAVMKKFGIPNTIIHSIITLFFLYIHPGQHQGPSYY